MTRKELRHLERSVRERYRSENAVRALLQQAKDQRPDVPDDELESRIRASLGVTPTPTNRN